MPHLSRKEISIMFQAFNNSEELYSMKVDSMIIKIMLLNRENGVKNHILTARPGYTRERTLLCLGQNKIFNYMSENDVHLLNYFEHSGVNKKQEKHDVIIKTQKGRSIFCDDSLIHLAGARNNCEDIILFGPELSWLRIDQVTGLGISLYKNTEELYKKIDVLFVT